MVEVSLFHVDGAFRALIHTGLTVNAGRGVHNCLVVVKLDCCCRADVHTGSTAGTLVFINYCYHFKYLK